MEKKKKRRFDPEMSKSALNITGLILLAAGGLGQTLRVRYFNVPGSGVTAESELMGVLDNGGFRLATLAVICQLAELAAIPIFAFLLTEGARRTSSFRKYLLRVLALAAVCEVPYSLLWNRRIFTAGSHNIVLGALMALVMLWFLKTFAEKTWAHRAVRILAVLGAFVWCNFLGIDHGAMTVVLAAVFWFAGNRPNIRILAGLGACLAGAVLSPLYFVCAAGLIPVHLYGGKKGRLGKWPEYLAYPVILITYFLLLPA